MGDLVSIIIPAYNVGEYIKECLDSVCNQTYKDIEIIVVDDGSTDNTSNICEELAKKDSRIVFIKQSNQGVVAARDTGIKIACGKYLAFVDGDDWIESGMIEFMINNISNTDMISIGVYHEKDEEVIINRFDRYDEGIYCDKEDMNIIYSRMIYDSQADYLHPMTSWIYNKLYRLDIAREIHGQIDKKIKFAEDSAFLFLYMLKCKSIVIKHECFYHYRYREGSAIHRANHYILDDINRFYNLLRPVFEKTDSSLELMYQLQKWVSSRLCLSVNRLMGFDDRVKLPRYIFIPDDFYEKRVALYGAGNVGLDYYAQFVKMGVIIVCWADKNYKKFDNSQYSIISPDSLMDFEYDILIICIDDEKIKNEIQKELINKGIDAKKIYWSKPLRLF